MPIHPALVPGIRVDVTDAEFSITQAVAAAALFFSAAVFIWAVTSRTGINHVGATMQGPVVANFAWFFSALVVAIIVFILVIGFPPARRIPFGDDDSEPDYSTTSWISMPFACMFIAKISRGRTLWQFIIAVVLAFLVSP